VLDVACGGCAAAGSRNGDEINQLSASGDGRLLAACDDTGAVEVYDAAAVDEHRATLSGAHDNICNTARFRNEPPPAWAADQISGPRVLSGGLDASIVTWSRGTRADADAWSVARQTHVGVHTADEGVGPVAAGGVQGCQVMNPPFVYSAASGPGGEYFVTGLGDGTVAFWSDWLLPPVERTHAAGAPARGDASAPPHAHPAAHPAHRALGRWTAHSAAVNQVHFVPFGVGADSASGPLTAQALLATAGDDLRLGLWRVSPERCTMSEAVAAAEDAPAEDAPPPPPPDCERCGKAAAGTRACRRCEQAFYCSGACAKAAWKGHKARCKQLTRAGLPRPAESEREAGDATLPAPPSVAAGGSPREGQGAERGPRSGSGAGDASVLSGLRVERALSVRHDAKVNWLSSSLHGSGSLYVADTGPAIHAYMGLNRV
jgi:hypothetical protein